MFGESAISTWLLIGACTVLAVGYAIPPLTDPGPGESQQSRQAAQQQYIYCAANVSGTDCECYAGRASHIMTSGSAPISGTRRVSKDELARNQAADGC